MKTSLTTIAFLAGALLPVGLLAQDSGPAIARVLPPPGNELPADVREALQRRLAELQRRCRELGDHPLRPDVEIFAKAVAWALQHQEFYGEKDAAVAASALANGEERAAQLEAGRVGWADKPGLLVRGFRSALDDSIQPYGLSLPAELDRTRPGPLYVWLHGRGDRQTDLHFLQERQTKAGQISPPGAIVLHPFGRHCLGFKSAGEIDVLEAIADVQQRYAIDPDRIVLMGFSMGGAGAWHLGAHYADRWVAVSPGAGFAETARYQNLTPDKYPPWYEQQLWGVYDVPRYVRNLFNVPVIAYSGELDKQIQAARVMEEAYAAEGRKLPHLIGPGMGHKYHPMTLAELLARIDSAVRTGRDARPQKVSLQTPTLRYGRMYWVQALGLDQHWQDSRVDAEVAGERRLRVTTRNITRLRLSPWANARDAVVEIDGQSVPVAADAQPDAALELERDREQNWRVARGPVTGLAKRPGLQGPIDDAFLEPFLVVEPTQPAASPAVQEWLEQELAHFEARWQAVFRGKLRRKRDVEVTRDDWQRYHLVLWGTPQTNRVLQQALPGLPVTWTAGEVRLTGAARGFAADRHLPVLIYPNPLQPDKYVVLNSGPTFREAHDRTNSQQNPKLPDWAIIDVGQRPSDSAPGGVAAAGFFDESWKVTRPEGRERAP